MQKEFAVRKKLMDLYKIIIKINYFVGYEAEVSECY
jgi:hypothetical protein